MKPPLEWWEELSFLSPVAQAEFGRLIEQLERGFTTITSLGPPDSPDGWAGISRRGPWARLVPSEWALAEASPEEFARRADLGELAFWELAHERGDTSRSVWVWLDVGPDQLGACRVVQIALLLWLQKSCLASGGDFYWGLIQEPNKGYEHLGADELRAFLAARSLNPPRQPPERLDSVQTWCIGSPQWIAQMPSGMVGVSLQQADLATVALKAQGRRLELRMPHQRRAIALLRSPMVWKLSSQPTELKAPHGRFLFNASGHKIIIATDEQLVLVPIPSSVNEPPGKPRAYKLPHQGEVIAVSMERRSINIVQQRGDSWVFSCLNPGQAKENRESVVPALEGGKALGSCWLRNRRWRLWLEDTFYEYSGGELEPAARTRGGVHLGAFSLMATEAGLLMGNYKNLYYRFKDIVPKQVFLARSNTSLTSPLPCLSVSIGHALALDMGSGRWRLLFGDKEADVVADGEVVGLFCENLADTTPMLVVRNGGCFTLIGPNRNEPLNLGEAVGPCQVHPNGLLAFHMKDRGLCCYDLNARARLWVVLP